MEKKRMGWQGQERETSLLHSVVFHMVEKSTLSDLSDCTCMCVRWETKINKTNKKERNPATLTRTLMHVHTLPGEV